ncbi:class I SAM-dependent methyltransferase [Streptococcus sp. zg-JUN1979]|uniref:class I SAM-dependent methyltransferase n=1 Tax=Streptococcus sp. zg-JUN1979 TaxID=3391450 RepID=UPI0039A65D90
MKSPLTRANSAYWTKRSKSYAKQHFDELTHLNSKEWDNYLTKALKKADIPLKKAVDIGTGPGFLAILLAQKGLAVDAIDMNEAMLNEASRNARKLEVELTTKQMNALDLEYEDESVDVVVSRNLTWNLEDPRAAYKEWLRILRPGGLLINVDANWYNYLFDKEAKAAYEQDRKVVEEEGVYDFYIHTDVSDMESIARHLPLSAHKRPHWDFTILKDLLPSSSHLTVTKNINQAVLTKEQQLNFNATPLFAIIARKGY